MALAILIHSSKTMRPPTTAASTTTPQLLDAAVPLATYLQGLTPKQLAATMQVSEALAAKVHTTFASWNSKPSQQTPAMDSFIGDIYSGLRAGELSEADRAYAQQCLYILSGLYGVLRPLDGVRPYRLEMGYKLPDEPFRNLYEYWGERIAKALPSVGLIVNLSAAEYTKTVLPYIEPSRVVAPRFLSVSPKTGVPGQVIVHTKIARGAFARWLITQRITTAEALCGFADLNYHYDAALSIPSEPTFVCETFGGIGLSVRLQK